MRDPKATGVLIMRIAGVVSGIIVMSAGWLVYKIAGIPVYFVYVFIAVGLLDMLYINYMASAAKKKQTVEPPTDVSSQKEQTTLEQHDVDVVKRY